MDRRDWNVSIGQETVTKTSQQTGAFPAGEGDTGSHAWSGGIQGLIGLNSPVKAASVGR
jgi:hypothetical protein